MFADCAEAMRVAEAACGRPNPTSEEYARCVQKACDITLAGDAARTPCRLSGDSMTLYAPVRAATSEVQTVHGGKFGAPSKVLP